MFGFLLSGFKLSLEEKLVSFLSSSAILPWVDAEITPSAMTIPPLKGGVFLLAPEFTSDSGFYSVASSSNSVPAFFDLPLDEGEFIKKVEVWANQNGIYILFSNSTNIQHRTIFAPRTNYRLVGYFENGLANIETKTSPIYSAVTGDFGGFYCWDSLPDAAVLVAKSEVVDSPRFFYTGVVKPEYESNLDDAAIISAGSLISDNERFFFSEMVTSTSESELEQSSVLVASSSVINTPYALSTSGFLLS